MLHCPGMEMGSILATTGMLVFESKSGCLRIEGLDMMSIEELSGHSIADLKRYR